MSTTTRKKGDTTPALKITCTDTATGDPVNLSTASSVRVIATRNGTNILDATTTGTSAGVVTQPLTAALTSTNGAVMVEVEVTWPDGTKQTFPTVGQLCLMVVPDLG